MGIKDIIKFIVDDFKGDIRFIKQVIKGTYKFPYTKEEIKEAFNPLTILRENWIWFLVLVLAFCVGYFFAEMQCYSFCAEWIEGWMITNNLTQTPQFIGWNFTQNLTP